MKQDSTNCNIVNSKPTYSLVTVTRNNLIGLQRTIDSAINQTSQDYELIIVDGDSTDGSKQYLSRIVQTDRVRWTSEPDSGIYDAMNKGISRSVGKWILFLNAGDTFESNTILEDVHPFTKTDLAVLYGDYSVDGHPRWARPTSYLRQWGMMTSHQAIFFNRHTCGTLLFFDTEYSLCGDFDLMCQILRRLPEGFSYINFRIASIESGGISSKNFFQIRKEQARIVYSHFGVQGFIMYFANFLVKSIRSVLGLSNEYLVTK